MKIVCTTCTYESIAVGANNLLPAVIHADGGFLDSGGYHCPNGHHCRVDSTGWYGVHKMPGVVSIPRSDSISFAVLRVLYESGPIEFGRLVVACWKRDKKAFGLHGLKKKYPCSKRVQAELSKRLKPFLEIVSPNIYRLTDEAREFLDGTQRLPARPEPGRETGGHNPARNGTRTVQRAVCKGGKGRAVGRTL